MARRIPTEAGAPAKPTRPAHEAATGRNGHTAPDTPDPPARPATAPAKEPERLKLSTLSRLEPGRPVLEIDGRVCSFQNPIALGALARHNLAGLFERLGAMAEISTPELEAEHLDLLVAIASIALPDVDPEVLRDLGDVQLDAVTGAFFVDAAGSLPAKRIARMLGLDASPRIGAKQSRGSRASTGRRSGS